MVTASDSTILIDVFSGSPILEAKASLALREANARGIIVICDVVYAEVCASFPSREECDEFLGDLKIKVESLDLTSSFIASRSWLSYPKAGGKRLRILPDFLIGAHARNQADALLTRDRGYYRQHFPGLNVIEP
jgi:predicted nucleic acid-binding protein